MRYIDLHIPPAFQLRFLASFILGQLICFGPRCCKLQCCTSSIPHCYSVGDWVYPRTPRLQGTSAHLQRGGKLFPLITSGIRMTESSRKCITSPPSWSLAAGVTGAFKEQNLMVHKEERAWWDMWEDLIETIYRHVKSSHVTASCLFTTNKNVKQARGLVL